MRHRSWGLGIGLVVAALAPPAPAVAFCGFYVGGAGTKLFNDATQVALLRDGTRTVLSMQNHYAGPPEGFAMVVPVPVVLQKENVKTLPASVFDKLDQLDAPRLVEYWEQDPCLERGETARSRTRLGGAGTGQGYGGGVGRSHEVTVEAQFVVGEYEIVILSAEDSSALEQWLRDRKYAIPQGAEPYFRPYVAAGSKFFVAKVDPKKVRFEGGQARLSPLRFHYDSETFSLPVRLGLVNARAAQDLVVHVLARGQRYEVANYPNVTIPTNLDVTDEAKASFGSFYASLFDATMARHPGAIVTEYSWDAGNCDPCSGQALDATDLATLGADVVPSAAAVGRGRGWGGSGWVLTRLHTRYGKENLGADLVFRAAPPIAGGREVRVDGALEHGASHAPRNNFQGRYALRHPWTGPITCEHPVRGLWGGPPTGEQPKPTAVRDSAFAKRGVALSSFVTAPVAELSPPAPPASSPASAPASSSAPAPPRAGGCGAAPGSTSGLGATLGLALLTTFRRLARRRQAPSQEHS